LPGKLLGIFVSSPRYDLDDPGQRRPNPAGAVVPMLGAAPIAVPAAGVTFPGIPMDSRTACRSSTAGAPRPANLKLLGADLFMETSVMKTSRIVLLSLVAVALAMFDALRPTAREPRAAVRL